MRDAFQQVGKCVKQLDQSHNSEKKGWTQTQYFPRVAEQYRRLGFNFRFLGWMLEQVGTELLMDDN